MGDTTLSFNGSGTFNINTSGQPVVAGTTITSAAFNALTADLATGLSTAICKDGQTTVTANIPLNNFKITGLGAGTLTGDAARMSQLQSGASQLLTSLTGTDTLTATLLPTLTAYTTGAVYTFVAANTNTTAVTLNIDALGAKAVTRDGSTALVAGDIVAGTTYNVMYDGTRFQLLSRASYTNLSASGNLTLSGGTADGVAYLNGSKVVTTGSGFVFDGSNLGVGAAPAASNFSGSYTSLLVKGNSANKIGTVIAQSFGTSNSTNIEMFAADGSNEAGLLVKGASTAMTFYTGSSPSKVMTLDSSGNLGLGVTPSAWATLKAMQFPVGALASYDGGASNRQINLVNNAYYDGANWKYVATDTAQRYTLINGQHQWFNAPSGTAGNAISFTQAMTLDSSGNLLVGTTNTSATAGVGFKAQISATVPQFAIVVNDAATSSSISVYNTNAAAYRFYVNNGGTIFATNTTISAISDQRFKENVRDLDVGLSQVLALQPRTFDWKEGKGKNIKGDRGFIAQEFEQVFPELIDVWADPAPEGEEHYKSVRQDLIPVLVKAIQEQQAIIQSLRSRIEALELGNG